MLLWTILAIGWLAVLVAAISFFRIAGYADKKVREFADKALRRDEAA